MEKEELIISKLDSLKQEIDFIKEHVMDITLTQDDIDLVHQAEDDLRKARTKRL